MTTKLSYPLPNLTRRMDSRVGDLVCVILDGDLTAILPLRDALLDEGRQSQADGLLDYFAHALIPNQMETAWENFAKSLLLTFADDLFTVESIVSRFSELVVEGERKRQQERAEFLKAAESFRTVGQIERWREYPNELLQRRAESAALLKEAEKGRK